MHSAGAPINGDLCIGRRYASASVLNKRSGRFLNQNWVLKNVKIDFLLDFICNALSEINWSQLLYRVIHLTVMRLGKQGIQKSFALIILPKDFMGIAWRIKILSWASRTWSQIVRGGLSPSDQPRQCLVGSLISLTHALPWFLHLSYYLVSNIICLAETIGFYGTVPVCNIFQRDFMVGSLLTNLYFRLFARVLSPKSWTSFCQSP